MPWWSDLLGCSPCDGESLWYWRETSTRNAILRIWKELCCHLLVGPSTLTLCSWMTMHQRIQSKGYGFSWYWGGWTSAMDSMSTWYEPDRKPLGWSHATVEHAGEPANHPGRIARISDSCLGCYTRSNFGILDRQHAPPCAGTYYHSRQLHTLLNECKIKNTCWLLVQSLVLIGFVFF